MATARAARQRWEKKQLFSACWLTAVGEVTAAYLEQVEGRHKASKAALDAAFKEVGTHDG